MVDALIKVGSDVNDCDDLKHTLLHIAAYTPDLDVIKLLIKASSRVDALDFGGDTPLDIFLRNTREIEKILQ